MAPSTEEFGGDVKTKTFVDFTQNGGNLMVFASSNIGDAIRELGAEFGIEYDETGTKVMTHQLYDFERDALNHDHSRFQLKASESFLGGSQPIVGPVGYAGLLIDNSSFFFNLHQNCTELLTGFLLRFFRSVSWR
jgi:oligosaccharyltransferase complex subunit beta